jgi:hypothetical protein
MMNMKNVRKKWPGVLLLVFFALGLQAQTITGSVFFDGNNNGTKDATEVGYRGITAKAYDVNNTEAASATSANLTGDYTLSVLTAGQKYCIEFTYLAPARPTPTVTSTKCSVNGLTFDVVVTSNNSMTADRGTVNGLNITGIPSFWSDYNHYC